MYIRNIWKYKDVLEVERYFSGRYGKKINPGSRHLPTPEEMRKVNERNAIKKLRRKIEANFQDGDLFITLTYRPECRPQTGENMLKPMKSMLRRCRSTWKKHGIPLKYIIVTEYTGKAIHHHIIINDLPGGNGGKEIRRLWGKNGGVNIVYLYGEGHYENLAAYLVKETRKTFRDPESPTGQRYSCSRNLIEPPKKTRILKGDNWPEDPIPPKGYYLDKGSLVNGFTKAGYRYQYCRFVKAGVREQVKKQKMQNSSTYNILTRKKYAIQC